jgi:Exopolyphosphatase-related proteins
MIEKWLEKANKIAIAGHMHPDGDCVGSCMGLYLYLQENYQNLQVDVYLEEIPETFHFIQRTKDIKHSIKEENVYDVFFALDCGNIERLGFVKEGFLSAKKTVCIDHHISNTGYAMENYIYPEASSTSELVYNLLEETRISKAVAECLYLGIVHDTGVFQYTATKPTTLRCAAVLMEKGVHASEIIQKTFYEKTYNQQRLLGYALVNSELYADNRCIVTTLSWEDMQAFEATANDTEGIASILRNTTGTKVAVFIYELRLEEEGVGEFKISLRANEKIDVNKVATHFGGGGHKKAAGFTQCGNLSDVVRDVVAQIKLQLNEEVSA